MQGLRRGDGVRWQSTFRAWVRQRRYALERPTDDRSYQQVEAADLIPFRELVAGLDGVMAAHLIFPQIDAQLVGFSPFWLQSVLRKQAALSRRHLHR